MMRATLLAATGVTVILSLAACSKKADETAPASEGAGTPAASASASSAAAKPTPGKWRVTSTVEGMPAGLPSRPSSETCLTAEDLRGDGWVGGDAMPKQCSEITHSAVGGAVSVHAVCADRGITTTIDIKASGDFTRRYTTEMTMSMSPAPPGVPNPMKVTAVSERVGDC